MTLTEMKKKILSMIEELDTEEKNLTSDTDIDQKLNHVINQVMYELARMKKIPDYIELPVTEGALIRFEDITEASGYEVYQLDTVGGTDYELKAQGTIIKAKKSGTLEIAYFRYPKRITEDTEESYEFDLSEDALEILPYGAAGDLLKSDVSTDYGAVYANRYEQMLQRLDTRYSMGTFTVEGGVDI